MIKSKLLTSFFQNYLKDKDIRIFRGKISYYIIFRLIRNFLARDIIIKIYNFYVYGSTNKNKTSYFLLKKCEFGDFHEFNIIKKYSNKSKILLLDCGCNYGFYSFYTASLSKENFVISIEASKKTSNQFLRNLKLNNFNNINFKNLAISNSDGDFISFNESQNDWESSQTHNNFKMFSVSKVKTVKIDTIMENYNVNNFKAIIKLDVEGNEIKAIDGAKLFIKKKSPLIIIEFSKFIFDIQSNINYLKNFLIKYNYSIYDSNNNMVNLNDVLIKLSNLKKNYNTIGNYYLVNNSEKNLKEFISNE